jgi:magnesium transporter
MQKTLQLGKTQRIFIQAPDKETIDKLAQEYGFHEMIVDDILGVNTQSKIDTSSDHFFLALTFTKYIQEASRYLFNELDVIIGENHIITTIGVESESFNAVFDNLAKEVAKIDGSYKSSPYYILYRIIDAFYDKTIKSLTFSSQKLLDLQTDIGDKGKDVVDELINEDLNKIFIKHNFLSQQEIIDDLIDHISKLHEKHLTTYFNSLKTKLAKIIRTINVLTEKNDSLMAAYNTFLGIKSNKSVTRLTFINSIFMPLTVIAGI